MQNPRAEKANHVMNSLSQYNPRLREESTLLIALMLRNCLFSLKLVLIGNTTSTQLKGVVWFVLPKKKPNPSH